MSLSDQQLVEAAQTIQQYCKEHQCDDCPLKRPKDWNCVLGGYWPINWDFSTKNDMN